MHGFCDFCRWNLTFGRWKVKNPWKPSIFNKTTDFNGRNPRFPWKVAVWTGFFDFRPTFSKIFTTFSKILRKFHVASVHDTTFLKIFTRTTFTSQKISMTKKIFDGKKNFLTKKISRAKKFRQQKKFLDAKKFLEWKKNFARTSQHVQKNFLTQSYDHRCTWQASLCVGNEKWSSCNLDCSTHINSVQLNSTVKKIWRRKIFAQAVMT